MLFILSRVPCTPSHYLFISFAKAFSSASERELSVGTVCIVEGESERERELTHIVRSCQNKPAHTVGILLAGIVALDSYVSHICTLSHSIYFQLELHSCRSTGTTEPYFVSYFHKNSKLNLGCFVF